MSVKLTSGVVRIRFTHAPGELKNQIRNKIAPVCDRFRRVQTDHCIVDELVFIQSSPSRYLPLVELLRDVRALVDEFKVKNSNMVGIEKIIAVEISVSDDVMLIDEL